MTEESPSLCLLGRRVARRMAPAGEICPFRDDDLDEKKFQRHHLHCSLKYVVDEKHEEEIPAHATNMSDL